MHDRKMMPALSWHTLVATWHIRPDWLLACGLLLVGYVSALCAAHRRGAKPVGPVRVSMFVLGALSLYACLGSSVDGYAMSLFWMHMIEHLTLIMVVPAFLVLGHPLTVLRASGGEA